MTQQPHFAWMREKILALHATGMPSRTIASHVSRQQAYVNAVIRKAGLVPTPTVERRRPPALSRTKAEKGNPRACLRCQKQFTPEAKGLFMCIRCRNHNLGVLG